MARLLGHRQTKEAATDTPNLPPPRHIPTLPIGLVGLPFYIELDLLEIDT
jgi:hypothetical protein